MLYIEVDGGCRDIHGYIGIGASASRSGQTLAQLSRSTRGKSSSDAELLAIAYGMDLAIAMGAKEALIATDCLSCINVLKGRSGRDSSKLRMRKSLLKLIEKKREANPGLLLEWVDRKSTVDAHDLSALALERYRQRSGIPGLKQRFF